jgi:hypothetical protein
MAKTANPETLASEIQTIFLADPGSIRHTTINCLEMGLFDGDAWEARIQAAMPRVRNALKALDQKHLPFAGPTTEKDEGGQSIWKPRTLWMFGDYEFNVQERAQGVIADVVVVRRMNDECKDRYGKRVALPELHW